MNKINKQNTNTLTDTEKTDSWSEGRRVGGLSEKGEGIKQKTKTKHPIQTNS